MNFKKFALPELKFDIIDFEPYISRNTVNVHYNVLHKKYVDTVNNMVQKLKLENYCKNNKLELLDFINNKIKNKLTQYNYLQELIALKNSLLGHINHTFFGKILNKKGRYIDTYNNSEIFKQIIKDFFTIEHFENKIVSNFFKYFSNGGGGIVYSITDKKLLFKTTSLHNTLILSNNLKPIICLDLGEHAYISDYGLKNLRQQYLKDIMYFIDGSEVDKLFISIKEINSIANSKIYFDNGLNI